MKMWLKVSIKWICGRKLNKCHLIITHHQSSLQSLTASNQDLTWKKVGKMLKQKIGINPTVTEPTWAGRPLVFAVLRSSFFVLTLYDLEEGSVKLLRSSLCFALTAQLRGAKRVLAKNLKPVFAGKLSSASIKLG